MNTETIYYQSSIPKSATILIIERGKGVRTQELSGSMTMGRESAGTANPITLRSSIVSRKHGEFIYADSSYYYRDTNSSNGTFYNGRKLRGTDARVKLNDGDILRIDRSDLNTPHPEAAAIIFSTFLSPDDKWTTLDLDPNRRLTIGRDEKSDIKLNDFMVSRSHAILEHRNGSWTIRDNGSKNGIAVNGIAVEESRPLNPFDLIRIADSLLIYLDGKMIYNTSAGERFRDLAAAARSVIMGVNINEVSVRKRFSLTERKSLLKNITLEIEAGDFILILGGSGAGKTTFINSLLGKIHADGTITINGMDLYRNFKMLKHKIGIVPQFSTTRDNDTVYHTIMDAAKFKLSDTYSKTEIKDRVESVIRRMMLNDLRDSFIRDLSGGQKKRVEVAIQAIDDQEIFILDEPDSGMDVASRIDLMNNLRSCTDTGGVVAVISHSPDDVSDVFTKVIVLAKSQTDHIGHLAYYGTIPEALDFFGTAKLSEIVMEINYEGGSGRADEFINKFETVRRLNNG